MLLQLTWLWMSFVNIDCQSFAVSVQQHILFIERLLLADAVHHLNDRKWAQSGTARNGLPSAEPFVSDCG